MKKSYLRQILLSTLLALLIFATCACNKSKQSDDLEDEPPVEPVGIEGLNYVLSKDESFYVITGMGNCTLSELTFPSEHNGKPVKIIASLTGKYKDVTSVVIPDSVDTIEESTFSGCNKLTSVTISNSVTTIKDSTFYGCSSLTKIVVPNSVKAIEAHAFSNCTSLIDIVLPDGITYVASSAFNDTAYINDQNNWYNDAFYAGTHLLKTNIAEIGGDYKVREGTTTISSSAFKGCESLTSVEIPNGVVSIGSEAFYDCKNLYEISIPDTVEYIGYNTLGNTKYFNDRYSEFKNSALYVGKHLIYVDISSSFTSFRIREGTICVAEDAFYCSSVTSIYVPASVKQFYLDNGFNIHLQTITVDHDNPNYCSVDGVLYNKNMTKLLIVPTKNCNTLVIPDTVVEIAEAALSWTNIDSVLIPHSVRKIGNDAFSNMKYGKNYDFNDEVLVFYYGTREDFEKIDQTSNAWTWTNYTYYYYSDTKPEGYEKLWHYVDSKPTIWE